MEDSRLNIIPLNQSICKVNSIFAKFLPGFLLECSCKQRNTPISTPGTHITLGSLIRRWVLRVNSRPENLLVHIF